MLDIVPRLAFALALLIGQSLQWYDYRRYGCAKRCYIDERSQAIRSWLSFPTVAVLTFWMVQPRLVLFALIHLPYVPRVVGICLIALGTILWVWSQLVLGRNWAPRVGARSGHTLTCDGPYRYVRHPMYTAFVLLTIGLLLGSANWLVGGLVGCSAWFTVRRYTQEEALMYELFPWDYEKYVGKTGAFLPRLIKA